MLDNSAGWAYLEFTNINSCIGFVARRGNNLIGMHLPQSGVNEKTLRDVLAKEHKEIDERRGTAETVANILRGSDEVRSIGCVDDWYRDCKVFMEELEGRLGPILRLEDEEGRYTVWFQNNVWGRRIS